MSRIDFYTRMVNADVLNPHSGAIKPFNTSVYNAENMHGYSSSPDHSTADQDSYESTSSGSGNTSSYEASESKCLHCAGEKRKDEYASYMQPYGYYKLPVSQDIQMQSVPQAIAPNPYFISSRGVSHSACYKNGLVVSPPCGMLPRPCFQSNSRACDEYLYNVMQYQYAQSAYYYNDQHYTDVRHLPPGASPPKFKYLSSQNQVHGQSGKIRHNHYSDDAVKNFLHYPIKEQIAKYEHLLSRTAKIENDAEEGIKQNRPSQKQVLSPSQKNKKSSPVRTNGENQQQISKTNKVESENTNSKKPATKTFLGLYEVLSMIGVGGGGVVYSGVQIADQKPVAIKRIMREKIKRWGMVEGRKVPQEIALMIKVNGHSNVIELLNWYECLDSFVMIMERPNNAIDLFDYIRAVGRIGEEEASYIFRQVVQAVIHVEEKGVLHRDVKDENVIINNHTKEVKLIDFGCGTPLHGKPYTDFSGTPEFYPPEWYIKKQYYGKPATVWSLGILLYDILCGEIPFKTKSKIIANKLVYRVSLSHHSQHLIQWMLTTDERFRPSLQDVLKHPWLSRKLS